ncbi:hypothetical protein GFY24_23500 [Nocardia sp. SYP-A9097]|nr:hypothetical protein [Nocardia sp. SYP-A9097]
MKRLPGEGDSVVFGEPYETADGTTVIAVTGSGAFPWSRPRPLGVFVLHGGEVRWESTVDAGRIALIGVLTGFVAAAFATAAVFKRPPWPDLHISHRL